MPGMFGTTMRVGLSVLLTSLWLSLMAGTARADMYTVPGLKVDETAATAAEARDKALAIGLRAGFARLLRQITPKSEWERLPALPEGQEQAFVNALDIQDEKGTTERYIATLTYAYDPGQVQQLLLDAGIPFTQSASPPTLILPLMRNGRQAELWQEGSPWLAAWAAQETEFGLVPIAVPFGDVDDVAAISAAEAVSGDDQALRRIADRYGLTDVVLADARLSGGGAKQMRLDVTMTFVAGRRAAPVTRSFVADSGVDAAELMSQAAGQMLNLMRDDWKTATLLETGDETVAAALIKVRDFADWQQIQRRLLAVPTIRKVDIISMSVQEVLVNVTYLGSSEQLQRAVERSALTMEDDNGFWTLRAGQG